VAYGITTLQQFTMQDVELKLVFNNADKNARFCSAVNAK